MSPQDFCYWLQGFSELTDKAPTAAQWKAIQDHLALTFVKVTPPIQWPNVTPGQMTPTPFPPLVVTC
jgi:hypothetical protein